MHKFVHAYVQNCPIYQLVKTEKLTLVGLFQHLPIPCKVWVGITVDFIDGLSRSQGKNTITVVVNQLRKFTHFLTLTHPYIAKTIVDNFIDGIIKLHGMPKSIISD